MRNLDASHSQESKVKRIFTVKPDQVFFKWEENVTFHVEMEKSLLIGTGCDTPSNKLACILSTGIHARRRI